VHPCAEGVRAEVCGGGVLIELRVRNSEAKRTNISPCRRPLRSQDESVRVRECG
jgi:hypothetical protein